MTRRLLTAAVVLIASSSAAHTQTFKVENTISRATAAPIISPPKPLPDAYSYRAPPI